MARARAFFAALARPRRLAAVCYGLFTAGWLLWGLFCLAYDRAQPETVLDISTAGWAQLEGDGGALQTTGGDPQLVFQEVETTARLVLLRAQFATQPGEMDLYYTRKVGQGFSAGRGFIGIPQAGGGTRPLFTLPGRRAIGRPVEEGWLYTLPPGHVQQLRVDLGTLAGTSVQVDAVVLNPRLPVGHYLLPTGRDLAFLAVAPALACCAVLTIIELLGAIKRAAARRATARKGSAADGSDNG